MVYRAMGLMSGSSLDGLDIAFAEFEVTGGRWSYRLLETACIPYPSQWISRLQSATGLSAFDYLQLHSEYGHYLGAEVNRFIQERGLEYKIQLIGAHGHTTFHHPSSRFTHQLGDGAAIAATTGIHVVSDLRAMDIALGGEGAPIVPAGEKHLFADYDIFLNLGGIANLTVNRYPYQAFDVCPANRVLNLLAEKTGKLFDENGETARSGTLHTALLDKLNSLDYYSRSAPKSLANSFGTDVILPMIEAASVSAADALCTYCEHIALQVRGSLAASGISENKTHRLFVTGGGGFNEFLMERLRFHNPSIEWIIADSSILQFKEALIMAFLAVLRWREENNVFSSVTGALRDSIGGAVWIGHD
jgi:anhydro-N-acetylmuramic acid kinase